MQYVNCATCGARVPAASRCGVCHRPLSFVRPRLAPLASEPSKSKILVLTVVGMFAAMLIISLVVSLVRSLVSGPSIAPSAAATVLTSAPAATHEEFGFYGDYKYSFQRQGEKVAALFLPKMLPRNDAIFIGATRKVISQAFDEDVSGSPTLVGGSIKFTGPSHSFMVTPIKEDTGEVHSLIIQRN